MQWFFCKTRTVVIKRVQEARCQRYCVIPFYPSLRDSYYNLNEKQKLHKAYNFFNEKIGICYIFITNKYL